MSRCNRNCAGGYVYHVLNRGVGKLGLFEKESDYLAFLHILTNLQSKFTVELFSYIVMPNHWHLLLRPEKDKELSEFMRLLTVTHTMRWHAHYETSGHGPIYQGRFKSFPVQTEKYFLCVARYIERNALRANLVGKAQDWPWSSMAIRVKPPICVPILSPWPITCPDNWTEFVNKPQSQKELEALRHCLRKGCPLGESDWTKQTAEKLNLGSTLRKQGRPPVT